MGEHSMQVRRKRVKRLIAQGANPTEMAERLDVSRSTIYRDIDSVKDEISELEEGEINEFLMRLKANFETVNSELWQMAYNTEQENIRLGSFKQIVKTNAEMVDVLQKTGILDKAAEELRVSGEAGIQFVVQEFPSEVEGQTIDAESVAEIEDELGLEVTEPANAELLSNGEGEDGEGDGEDDGD